MIRAIAVFAVLLLAAPAFAGSRTLPARMQGIWGYEATSCTVESDDGRVEIGPDFVTSFASHCTVAGFRARPDGTLVTHGRCRGEGEEGTEPGSVRLRLAGPDRLSIALGGEGHVYRRCLGRLPVR